MPSEFRFTVMTSTYNRAEKLERTFRSIQEQTFRNFEWIVVDDGSSDETAAVMQEIIGRASFPVKYIYQENGHKHVAINRAVKEARGELLVIIDDDDQMKPNALERFDFYWSELRRRGEYDQFCCVTANCEDLSGRCIGTPFPEDWFVSDSLAIHVIHRISGEKFGCQRVDIMREFPFEEDARGHCIPESVIWLPMAKRYKTLFVNDQLRVYYTDAESAVTTDRPWKNAVGAQRNHRLILNDNLGLLPKNPKFYLKSAAAFSRYSFHLGKGTIWQLNAITPLAGKMLLLAGIPVGYLIYRRDVSKDKAKGLQPPDFSLHASN